jgi:hypothetical protein
MLIDYACKIVFHNPSDEGQVYPISGGAAGTPVNLESATFANCVVTPVQIGSTPFYEYSLPTGLSAYTAYPVTVYASAATAFTDARLQRGVLEPDKVTPIDIDGLGFDVALKRILSAAGGVVGVTDNHDGTYTLSFKAADGTTEVFTRTFNPSTGVRS